MVLGCVDHKMLVLGLWRSGRQENSKTTMQGFGKIRHHRGRAENSKTTAQRAAAADYPFRSFTGRRSAFHRSMPPGRFATFSHPASARIFVACAERAPDRQIATTGLSFESSAARSPS